MLVFNDGENLLIVNPKQRAPKKCRIDYRMG